MLDAGGQPLATLDETDGTPPGVYRDRKRQEIASTAPAEGGVRLRFRLGEPGNPFVKMVLLAAALVHNEPRLREGTP